VSIPAEPDVNLRFMTPDEARKIAPAVFEAATIDRPGTYGRPDWWWTHRVFLDHKEFRDGLSEQRWVVAEVDGEPVGYVRYRTKLNWENTGANGKVAVREFTATTDQASRALWSFLSTIDLFPQVEFWNAPPDDVLPWIATDPRHINYAISEALWVRILDVAEALERRSYAADGSVVLDIDDAFIPETSGRYELSVTEGTATVTTTDQPADVALGIDMLGSIYLGYHRAGQLQRAARISGSAEGVATLDRIMAWPVPAWTQEIF
jgi:predicted acetyltransferase